MNHFSVIRTYKHTGTYIRVLGGNRVHTQVHAGWGGLVSAVKSMMVGED